MSGGWDEHRDALAAESQRLRDEAYAAQLTPPKPERSWEQQEQDRMIAQGVRMEGDGSSWERVRREVEGPAPPRGITVAAADIGSIGEKNVGWAIRDRKGCWVGDEIDDFAGELVRRLKAGARLILAFEAPLYVPMPQTSNQIGKRRNGEFVQRTHNGVMRMQARPFGASSEVVP
jgi:hypothetical protein